jgi:hypothetical protein
MFFAFFYNILHIILLVIVYQLMGNPKNLFFKKESCH